MSTTKATPPSNLTSTRQMLDELDALMERMLALPVNDLDDVPREPPQRPALAATLTVLEEPNQLIAPDKFASEQEIPGQEAAGATETRTELSSYQSYESSAPTESDFAAPNSGPNYEWPDQVPELTHEEDSAPIIRPRSTTVVVPFRKPRRTLLGWILSPLVRFNLAFDRWMGRLGRAGAWTRRPWGRLVLGIVGLALMLGAIGWILYDRSNWTR